MNASNGYERPAIAGSGAIACGLAAAASVVSDVVVLARSDTSAERAEGDAREAASKLDGGDPERIAVTSDRAQLADRDLVVEAIVEDLQTKADLLGEIAEATRARTSRRRPRRCGSPRSAASAAAASASSGSTSSTRSRR